MYGALWRVLPGPWWVRVLLLLVLAAIVITLLMAVVFPWLSPIIEPYILPADEIGLD